jgi:hypothetical protein
MVFRAGGKWNFDPGDHLGFNEVPEECLAELCLTGETSVPEQQLVIQIIPYDNTEAVYPR